MKRKALITGGAGFIGSHLVDLLLKEGNWDVTVVDNFDEFYSPEIKQANVNPHLENPNYRLYKTDICDLEGLKKVFQENQFELIVHLAALAGVRPSILRPRAYARVNVEGTVNLLEMAKEFGIRKFIFGSSSSVYGINCKVPFSEDDKISLTISPYASTKAAGELLCHTYSHLYGIKMICLRFFTVYGARQRPDLAIHKFSRLIWEGKPIPMFGDGTTKRDYTYIEDILQGVRAAIDYDKSQYEIFNLGESRTVELRYLINLLEENLGKKAIIEQLPPQPGDVPITFADISKARKLLGYNPQTPIEKGIKEFTDWFKEVVSV
ncbi:MAG: NAD-dependent epimerase/dehydratase family protein [Acidobacteria bacterium]|jgi:UDP-glucuronate 4-epimerase|nr:MAG: NAD-dependent epimerase/dehydratase family protein [Acidobacteriota bacterium]GIU82989.1 MAG: epimerase [Pyrinomonadaceae bacterium]